MVGFLSRHPFSTDAYASGYAVGFREDGTFQDRGYPNVDLPVNVLDNEFRNPDLDRYRERFEQLEPDVGIVADAYSAAEAVEVLEVVDDLRGQYPDSAFVTVPKNRDAFEELSGETVLGYANGYSDVKPDEFSTLREWRDERIWLLGGSPSSQYQIIQQLTQPTLDDAEPADITGLDGNCAFKAAFYGEFYSPRGWQRADHLSIRETVERSLQEMKAFWQRVGVWPDTEPRQVYGPAVQMPDEPVWLDRGGDPIPDKDGLERSHVEEYDGLGTVAFEQDSYRKFVEHRDGLEQV